MSYSEKMLDQLNAGQLEAAKKSFAWALRKDDDDTLFNLAEQLYGLGFLHQAQRIYLKLLDKYPDEDEIKTSLAEIAIDGGHNDEALAYLSQVSSSSPAYLQSLLVAADLYQTEEQFEVTEEKLREAYEIAPTDDQSNLYINFSNKKISVRAYSKSCIIKTLTLLLQELTYIKTSKT